MSHFTSRRPGRNLKTAERRPTKVDKDDIKKNPEQFALVVATDGASSNNGSKDPNKPVAGSYAYCAYEGSTIPKLIGTKSQINKAATMLVAELYDDGTESLEGDEAPIMYHAEAMGEVTNNQMEMKAIIEAMKDIAENVKDLGLEKTDKVVICSDSQICIEGMVLWRFNWQKNNWKNSQGEPVANQDLWLEMIAAWKEVSEVCNVSFCKVKGHDGVYYNEMADSLAVEILKRDKDTVSKSVEEVQRVRQHRLDHKSVVLLIMRVPGKEHLSSALFVNNVYMMSFLIEDNPMGLYDHNLTEFAGKYGMALYDNHLLESRVVFPGGGFTDTPDKWREVYQYYITEVI